MFFFIKLQTFLLPTLLFILYLSVGASQHHGRVVEATNCQTVPLILAAKRTHRIDPLDGFNYYEGGWNISDEHYLSSVAFTAAPLFITAALWFLGFGLCSFFICHSHRRFKHHSYGSSRSSYFCSLSVILLFSIAAVTGCLALYVRQEKFHSVSTKTLEFVVKKAESRVENFRDVSNYLEASKHVGVGWAFVPLNMQKDIDKAEKKANHSADTLQQKTDDNSDDTREVLDSLRVILIVIATVMVLIAFVGTVSSIFGNKCLVHSMVITGWILVTVTFVLSGIFLVLHNVSADTCVAMDEWDENPEARTAFHDILPCVDNSTAQKPLNKTKDFTFRLVGFVDRVIATVYNFNNVTPNANVGLLYYNQSGPLVPALCNPFNSDMTHRNCADDEVDFIHAAMEWRNYVCEVSATGICTTVGRLKPFMYEELIGALNVSYALYHYAPLLVDLEECNFVREALREISEDQCPGLRRHSRWIAMLLAMVSASLMVSTIFWLLHSRHKQKYSYVAASITPPYKDPYVGDRNIK